MAFDTTPNIIHRSAEHRELNAKLDALIATVARLETTQKEQASSTADLVEAWNTGKGLVQFMKWLAVIAGPIFTALAIYKGYKS